MTIVPALMLPYFVWKHHRVDGAGRCVVEASGLRPAEPVAGGSEPFQGSDV